MIALALALTACPKPAPQTAAPGDTPGVTALAILMKNRINPAFSKLTFLVFHGDELQEDPNAVRMELQRTANLLKGSVGELKEWREPPTDSTEGREVFYTYTANVDQQARQLFDAIERHDAAAAQTQMQDLADTCNNCHHFFRLKVEDSVVPGRGG
jgi:hypothetical protein